MEAVQRHVVKWFKKDKNSSSSSSSHSVPNSPSTTAKSSWLRTRLSSDDESDGAKYWSNAKTRRKLKHLVTKRELPPLPPGAKIKPPDIYPTHRINLDSRGVDSPAHIYEEIPSWAVDNSQQGRNVPRDARPILPKDCKIPQQGFSNAGFSIIGNRKGFHVGESTHSYAQLAVPVMRSRGDDVDLLKTTAIPQRPSLHDLDHVEASKQLMSGSCPFGLDRVPFTQDSVTTAQHPREDSVDACYEYDINKSMMCDSAQCDSNQSSFRSCNSSVRDRSESSNDTFSEYDMRTEDSPALLPDYDNILLKIRDNLKLKEDVQRLVYGGSLSDGATLTNASSMSEISTLADDEVDRLLTPKRQSTSSLPRPPPARRISQPVMPSSSSSRARKPLPPPPPTFHSEMDLSSMSSSRSPDPVHHISGSMTSLIIEEDSKLSCRVSSLRPDTLKKRRPSRSSGRPPVPPPSRRTSTGSNRLLADIVQRNHDMQTLLL
ncbi:hypothetical protein CAPTEDRAFT_224053 [Capitella teleta]|uniref:Uncharacterized protein n=1 Tax=Capitella teleta TaxID=283909 RepID=R7V9T2_CAPTE|nr:hypothetical protein CAPTEDRAFT_224053 [Capitella teleta]|eukprot:ELU15252.1 hypothetical protein CAPTEDRAFT_224053 [Capitella teleta]